MKKSRLLDAVYACVLTVLTSAPHAAPISGQGTWETTLQGRDMDGNLRVEAWRKVRVIS